MSVRPSRSITVALRPAVSAASPEGGAAVLAATLVAVAVVAVAAHASVGLGAPLWLDESWTGAFAALPSLSDLTSEARDDANGPIYSYLIWFWARLFGTSDVALHAPSVLLGCAAPVIAWIGLRRSRPRVAIVWTVMLALWGPGIVQSGYARCYALLLCTAVLSSVALLHWLEAPTRRQAVLWAASASLMVLTHYHAGPLAVMQGMAFLLTHRRRALAQWPAALVFLPAFCWIAWHLPRLAAFLRPGVGWYRLLGPGDIPDAAAFMAGCPRASLGLLAIAILLVALLALRGRGSASIACDLPVLIVGGASLAAAVVLIGSGFVRPLFTMRYLTPVEPGLLLVAASGLAAASRGRPGPLAAVLGGLTIVAALFWLGPPHFRERVYSFEAASAWLGEVAPRRLVFFWDNPTAQAETEHQLDLMGGFFLRRAGHPVAVTPVVLEPGADMNERLLAEAGTPSAILWLSDTNVHDTTARLYPPRLAELAPALECRDFGDGSIGVMACRTAKGR